MTLKLTRYVRSTKRVDYVDVTRCQEYNGIFRMWLKPEPKPDWVYFLDIHPLNENDDDEIDDILIKAELLTPQGWQTLAEGKF